MTTAPLTDKQRRFVEEYLVDLNATQAAIRAGYSERTAYRTGADNLRKPQIAAAIADAQAARSQRTQVEADQVVKELALLAFSDIGQVLDFAGDALHLRQPSAIPESARRCISGIKVRRYTEGRGEDALEVEVTEFKLWSKTDALEKLGRHLGLFKDILEHRGMVKVVEEVVIVDGDGNPEAPETAASGAGEVPPQ